MLPHHLRIALRALRRDRAYALLNGVGLAVALACCLLVGLFVRAERSVDRFHPELDRLRAVWQNIHWSPESEPGLATPIPLAGVREEHAAIERAVVVDRAASRACACPGATGLEDLDGRDRVGRLLRPVRLPLLRGDPDRVLAEPGIVLRAKRRAPALWRRRPDGPDVLTLERWRDTLRSP